MQLSGDWKAARPSETMSAGAEAAQALSTEEAVSKLIRFFF